VSFPAWPACMPSKRIMKLALQASLKQETAAKSAAEQKLSTVTTEKEKLAAELAATRQDLEDEKDNAAALGESVMDLSGQVEKQTARAEMAECKASELGEGLPLVSALFLYRNTAHFLAAFQPLARVRCTPYRRQHKEHSVHAAVLHTRSKQLAAETTAKSEVAATVAELNKVVKKMQAAAEAAAADAKVKLADAARAKATAAEEHAKLTAQLAASKDKVVMLTQSLSQTTSTLEESEREVDKLAKSVAQSEKKATGLAARVRLWGPQLSSVNLDNGNND
jgi:chromosome segregation ATPase